MSILMWILFYVPLVFIGMRYRLYWRDGTVVQKASGMADVEIEADAITRIVRETSKRMLP